MKRKGKAVRTYRALTTGGAVTTAANRYKFNFVAVDVATLLANLAGAGEEFHVSKATLHVQLFGSTLGQAYAVADISAVVNDSGGISGTDPGENSVSGYLDDDVDVLAGGEYEMQKLGRVICKLIFVGDGAAKHQQFGTSQFNITSIIQRASALLARSALLTTTPNICIIGTGISDVTNPVLYYRAYIEVQGVVQQKPLRMLV